MSIRWTLITVTYNSSQELKDYWSGDRPDDVEWIVVDNASTDGTESVARELGAVVIPMGRNAGFSAANNRALADANGLFIGFVNPDVKVSYDGLPTLEETIQQYDCVVSPQLLNPDRSLQPNGRGFPSFIAKITHRLRKNDEHGDDYRFFAGPEERIYVAWLMGAAVCSSREIIDRVGGWNDDYFIYYEDSEFGLRSWDAGIPVILDGRSNWIHGWARETTTFRIKPWIHEIASASRFYFSHPSLSMGARAYRARYPEAADLLGGVASDRPSTQGKQLNR